MTNVNENNPDNAPAILRLARYILAEMLAFPHKDREDERHGGNEAHHCLQIMDGLHDDAKIAPHFESTIIESIVRSLESLTDPDWVYGDSLLRAFTEILDKRMHNNFDKRSREIDERIAHREAINKATAEPGVIVADDDDEISDEQFAAIKESVLDFNNPWRRHVIISTSDLADHLEGNK